MKGFLVRHKVVVGIWAVVFMIVGYGGFIMLSTSKGDESPDYLTNKTTPQPPNAQTLASQVTKVKKGEAAKDGDLQFTVTGVACNGEQTIGTPYAQAEAEGSFCRLKVAIKNTGTKATDLPLAAQRAFVRDDKSVHLEEDATQYAQADQTSTYWYKQITPGKTVTGDLVFAVNGGEELQAAELHSAEGSPGIKVTLQ